MWRKSCLSAVIFVSLLHSCCSFTSPSLPSLSLRASPSSSSSRGYTQEPGLTERTSSSLSSFKTKAFLPRRSSFQLPQAGSRRVAHSWGSCSLYSARMSSLSSSSRPLEVRGVLFDIDGTLFDSDPCHLAVFQDLLQEEGFNDGKRIDEDFFRLKIAGRQNQQICAEFFPSWTKEQGDEWAVMKEARFREMAAGKLEAMEGLERVLDWIEKGNIKKAAVTNAPRLNAEFMLGVINRLDWFDQVIIGDECQRAKPDPMPYQIAMERLGLSPEHTIVVEDSPSGARAGAASGAFTIGILSSQPADVLTAAGCQALIKDYNDPILWEILEGVRAAN